ncbi:MAG: DUF4389 domain-containing protein [Gaiellaceae bacterium]
METNATSTPGHAQHPVRLVVNDDLRRTRLTVFFRLFLAIPHYLWLTVWLVIAMLASIVNWFATLIAGRSPNGLHDFLATYLRYQTHVTAYAYLIADPFPGFTGRLGSYPIDLEIDPPEPQNRLTVFFRLLLALPALFVARVLSGISALLAIFSWFIALALGRVPEGLRNFAAFALRFETQTAAYVLLLTGRYPSFNIGIQA